MEDIITKFAGDKSNVNKLKDLNSGEIQQFSKDTNLVQDIVNILNVVLGLLSIVCVVVIIIGGITYMTSTGDSTKVKKGKDTILYGIIGLVICILAFAIVNFVIANIKG